MFTGLVEEIGRLRLRVQKGGARLSIDTAMEPLVLGESIAVMGVCLTVETIVSTGFEADASAETLARTTLGTLGVGSAVHLERATAVGDRLGGHIVAGHVDAMARVVRRELVGNAVQLTFATEGSLMGFVAEKGSVAIDGVSLTVNRVEGDEFAVMLVPHTQRKTLLESLGVGARVNLEVDLLARYVARWLSVQRTQTSSDASLMAKLASSGYL